MSDISSVKSAALSFLAQREHSKHELLIKLSRRFSDEMLIQQVITSLAENDLQSDERFVEAFIRAKKAQGKGPQFIKYELKQRGVSEYLIAACVYENDESWLEMAARVYTKKFGTAPVEDKRDKAKRIRFMVSRGFSPACAYQLIES